MPKGRESMAPNCYLNFIHFEPRRYHGLRTERCTRQLLRLPSQLVPHDLVRATRPHETDGAALPRQYLAWGAGPRAAQSLILGAKARALLHHRFAVSAADLRAMAGPVLRHRMFTNFNADAEGITTDDIVKWLLENVHEPGEKDYASADLQK